MSQGSGYRFGQHAGAARSFRDPTKLIKQGANAEVYKPSWKHTSTIFRPHPVFVNGQPQPYRYDAEDSNFTDWIRCYRAVMGVGNPGIDFILCDPSDPNVDRAANPYEMIYAYVKMLQKSNSLPNHIFALTQGGPGRGAALPNTTSITVMQGSLLMQNNEPKVPAKGSAVNDPTGVMVIKQQAGDDLIALLNQRREPNQPPDPARAAEDPFASQFYYGDITHIRHGAFIHFIQKGAAAAAGGQNVFGGQRANTGARQRIEDIGYAVSIMDRLSNGAPADMSSMANILLDKWTPWEEIIHIPTVDEQIRYLCAVLPADLIVSALADRYRELIPQQTMQAGFNRIAPGSAYAGPPQGAPQGYGQQNPTYPPQQGGGFGAPPQGGGYGPPPPVAGGFGAPAPGGGFGYDRPIDPGIAPAAQGAEYGWSGQPGYPPQGGQPGYPPQGGQPGYAPQGGQAGYPPNGGYGQPQAAPAPAAGGFGAPPPQGGGFGAPPPAAGGFGAPPPQGGFGAPPPQGGFGAPPPQGGFGAPPPQTGMMTPGVPQQPIQAAPVDAVNVNVQSAVETARRAAAGNAQPPVMPAAQ